MSRSFEEILLNGNEEDLNNLKRWLFDENVRLSLKQKEITEMYEKFMREKVQFQEDMNSINLKVVNERKRLKDEEMFFDKKMDILKNGFMELEADRKRFEKEKALFNAEKKSKAVAEDFNDISVTGSLFAGCNNLLALKKRYRDLLKIFHPDNLCGDKEMVTLINKEYERLKREIDFPFKLYK